MAQEFASLGIVVSTHSRPKAAADVTKINFNIQVFQHTAARRRLPRTVKSLLEIAPFQHTAARRRLLGKFGFTAQAVWFQHTAARRRLLPT